MIWYDGRARRNRQTIANRLATAEPQAPATSSLRPELAAELQHRILGEVVLPGDSAYDAARRLANPRFSAYPQAIVFCEVEADVRECLSVAQRAGLAVVVRSGGHSTGGFSANDGLVLDVSRIDDVCVDAAALTVWAGPGCTFGKLNARLEWHDLHTPGGACPDVCIGGYVQGGGYGFTARIFGMNCDQVEAVRVMRADGRMVEASRQNHPDLFWAVRGGTGSNFGVLMAVKYRLYRGATFTGFSIAWTMDSDMGAAQVAGALTWLQAHFMRNGAPDGMGYQMIWVFEGPDGLPRKPYLLMRGMFRGDVGALRSVLQPVLALPGATLQALHDPQPYSALSKALLTQPYEVPQFPADTVPMPPPEAKLSRYVDRPIPTEGWRRLIGHFLSSPSPYTTVAMEIYGGAIARVPEDDNAFVHRGADFDIFCDVFWLTEAEEAPMLVFLDGWKQAMAPFWNGHVYQNYPSIHDPDFARNYWGAAYPALQAVKSAYDPHALFRYPQGVTPLPGKPDGHAR